MRESFGGTMLFWIVLFFLTIFIFFIASIIKYARVYKIKNTVINYIERNEGIESKDVLISKLRDLGYGDDGHFVICRYYPDSSTEDAAVGGYYFLQLYAKFEIPIVGNLYSIEIKIKGDTRNIETGTKIRGKDELFDNDNTSPAICKHCKMLTGECSPINM